MSEKDRVERGGKNPPNPHNRPQVIAVLAVKRASMNTKTSGLFRQNSFGQARYLIRAPADAEKREKSRTQTEPFTPVPTLKRIGD